MLAWFEVTTSLPVRRSSSATASTERHAVHEQSRASASGRHTREAKATTSSGSLSLMPWLPEAAALGSPSTLSTSKSKALRRPARGGRLEARGAVLRLRPVSRRRDRSRDADAGPRRRGVEAVADRRAGRSPGGSEGRHRVQRRNPGAALILARRWTSRHIVHPFRQIPKAEVWIP